jgi:hypothetical protein
MHRTFVFEPNQYSGYKFVSTEAKATTGEIHPGYAVAVDGKYSSSNAVIGYLSALSEVDNRLMQLVLKAPADVDAAYDEFADWLNTTFDIETIEADMAQILGTN